MKRFFTAILFSFVFFLPALAQDTGPRLDFIPDTSVIHAIVSETCPHCRDFKNFMESWEDAPGITYYDVEDGDAYDFFLELQDIAPNLTGGVPMIILDGNIIEGFSDSIGENIQSIYKDCSNKVDGCLMLDAFLHPVEEENTNTIDILIPELELVIQEDSEAPIIHAFVHDLCIHCADFKKFMKSWDGGPKLVEHNIVNSEEAALFTQVKERAPSLLDGVPTIIFDGQILQGYDTDETSGVAIKNIFNTCAKRDGGCMTFDAFLDGEEPPRVTSSTASCIEDPTVPCEIPEDSRFIFDFWFIGETDLRTLSLPTLSIILGGLDGFNPCAMWVLITLLALLINTRSWPKMIVIGSTFLIVSGVMYYLFIAAWLNVFLLIGFNFWVQKIIGIVAIGGGGFYLYEAFGKNPNECKVTNLSQRQKIINKMKQVMEIASWPLMIIGVAVLAFSVNLIELVCTAGLPAIFTGILAQNDLSTFQHYWYLLLYILAYMFDDMVVYIIAISTLRATGLTSKYQRFTFIFGGVLMATLGILLIFYPQVLMFG